MLSLVCPPLADWLRCIVAAGGSGAPDLINSHLPANLGSTAERKLRRRNTIPLTQPFRKAMHAM
jgi:hypothetical protein